MGGTVLFLVCPGTSPIFLEPPQARKSVPANRPMNPPSWRPRRPQSEPWASEERRGQQIGRWIRRRAGCLLYSRWPAPRDRFVPFAGRGFLELCGVVAAWPGLPEAIRAVIVAMGWFEPRGYAKG